MSRKALEGIKIADFTWVAVGPLTIKYLADHGAEVVHVESSVRPEMLRVSPPFKDKIAGINRSAYNACLNNNKYGLGLNLNHPGAREVLERLVKWADVVAESFSPGMMARWGLAYEDLVKIKPDIIMYSTSQQGQTGPYAKIAAYGAQLVSLAGFTHLAGWPGRDPTGPQGPYTDTIAPSFGAVAIIAALMQRRRTGKGTHIDLSQLEAGVNFLAPAMLDYNVNGRVAQRDGNRYPYAAPHGIYPCKGDDRWCSIAVFTDEEWGRLCGVMGKPELAKDDRFSMLPQRKRNEDELDTIISDWTSGLSAEDVMALCQKAGIAAGVAKDSRDIQEDPQLAHRHFLWELEHREIGKHYYEAPPFKLSRTPCELNMAGPCIGEHNEHVCTRILGFTDEEFVRLVSEGVLE
ncbi:MAG: CoA transferase [Chloroflexi bacterium]|nr:CoA transferase [Chloroflexota bacterium]